MKGQKIFYSFLPGVTAAVLTTQPALADTVKVNEDRLTASSSVLTSTDDETAATLNINMQATAVSDTTSTPLFPAAGVSTASLKLVSGSHVGFTLTGKTGVPVRQVAGEVQDVLLNMTPTPQQTELINKIRSAVGKKQAHSAVEQHSKNTVTPSSTSQTASSTQEKTDISSFEQNAQKKVETQLSKPPNNQVGATVEPEKFSEQVEFCSQQQDKGKTSRSAALLLNPSSCSPKNTLVNQFAQANTSTSQSTEQATPTANTDSSKSTQQANPTSNTDSSKSAQQANPTSNTDSSTTTAPATSTQGGAIAVPDYLNPSPNPLQFPTRPEEVRIQGTQPISLAQALELARRNNRDLQRALLTLERSRAALRVEQAALYPTIDINGQVTRSQSAGSQISAEQRADAGLPPIEDADSPTTALSVGPQLTYNLYTAGQRSARIRQAEEQLRFNELDVERQSEDIRLNVTTQYYDLQQADEDVRIAQSAVNNAQASLRDAQALERAGVSTRFEVLQAQVNLANAQQQLTNALSQQRISRRQLAETLSLAQAVDVSAADPVKLAGLWNQTLEQTIVRAFQNRPELQQQLAQRNIAEQQRREALGTLGPQVSLVASYNLQDVFNDSVGLADGYSLGLQANFTLFDGGRARAQADQAKAQIRIAENDFADQRNQIRFEVEQAYSQLQSNLENVQTANAAVEQAREALRLARLRFQAGVGTQTEVIDAENALTRSEGQRVQAILNYNRALASLQRAITARAGR